MQKYTTHFFAILALSASFGLSAPLFGQQLVATASDPASLPNAPIPQNSADSSSSSAATGDQQQQQTTTPAQTPTPQAETAEQHRQRADKELQLEEKQRIAGVIPNFNTVNNGVAASITPAQKFHLFFKGAFDPYQFALAGIDAGIGQAENENPGYNQGLKGFARRYGANYGDNFDGNFWGNAVLPSVLHQDPRYFRLGHGTILHRAFYSVSTTLRTRGDNGHWEPNYSNLIGNLIGASISNVYYPDGDRGLYPTLRRGLSVTYQGTLGGLLQEFYPDVVQKIKQHRARKAAEAAADQGITPIPPAPRPTPQP